MQRPNTEVVSFALLVAFATAGFIWVLSPYYGAVLWAMILAILFRPLYLWLLARLGGRKNTASALCLLAAVLIVVVPGTVVVQSVIEQANLLLGQPRTLEFSIAAEIRNLWARLPDFMIRALSWIDVEGPEALLSWVTALLGRVANAAGGITLQMGQSTVALAISLGIMLYTLFFLLRDGAFLLEAVRRVSPLSERHTALVIGRFGSVVKATVKGNVLIALLQGSLGGAIFWVLGLNAALLWGVVMALLSLLPVVGAAIVWVPVAAYLVATGSTTAGIILFAFGILVVSTIDNLLRPLIVGKDLRLPDFLVLLSTAGGLTLIGGNGFVVGPMIAALFVAVWASYPQAFGRADDSHERSAPDSTSI